jgi:predicted esterase
MKRWLGTVLLVVAVRADAQQATMGGDARAQLAAAYLRLELALREHPLNAASAPGVNRAFDAATLAFFGGRTAETIAIVDSLTATIEPDVARRERLAREGADRLAAMGALRRVASSPAGTVPYRLHVPRTLPAGPRPLLVALHGTGGDENMFLEGYGAGRIAQLADQYGVVVVTPFTNAVMRGPELFDALVADVARNTPVDTANVALLGHSLGAGAAWRLAWQRATNVRAVVCLAGACGNDLPGMPAPKGSPRILAIAGELDPIAAPARVKTAVDAGVAAGRSIDYGVLPGFGHTLMVGEVLPRAFVWLFGGPRS